ncbi:choice-of-anchor J domain-containing protein [Hymenobacter sp. BT175]|uniref:T9SS-dependent choice-of-anchor J family protein n=1 Tax=Hymenobacter translucens TaxID=2886507 RepID=UPI001D0F3658|nr:T9SS type A sorting domain-containing protein [Hymenobacter translucens]MCC2547505.1 choice-of-anchor J domain-containing protein [Hymenobacter translucens]
MTNKYNLVKRSASTWRKLALAAAMALGGATAAQAQALNYTPSGFVNTTSTYADLGTTGTVITTANTDDANSAATPIGFTFNFNGTAFTDFVLNTNGYVKLGTTPPTAPFFMAGAQDFTGSPVQAANQPNLLMPFNVDLMAATTGTAEYRVATTGATGSRICTIQWKNVKDKPQSSIGTQYDNFSFQVKLYEGTDRVEFVYGAATAGTGPDAFRYINIGVKGSGGGPGQLVMITKGSTGAWSTATALGGDYTTGIGNAHNVRSTVRPDAGRTYRFNPGPPTPAIDAAAVAVYTLGKLAVPASLPHTVQAAVRNNGTQALTNVPVTLTVSGANTFTDTKTIPSLATGATVLVTFAPYPATMALGTNAVRVSTTIAGDGNTANDASTYSQLVTSNQLAIADQTVAYNATGIGVGVLDGIMATKYTVTQPTTVNEVRFTFAASANNVQTYQVVLLDATGPGGTPGSVFYTSANQTRTPAAGTATILLPAVPVSGTFFLGMKETASSATNNPQIAYQIEDPLRPATFYFRGAAGTAWTDLAATTFKIRLGMELSFGAAVTCVPPSGVTAVATSPTTASVNFTPSAGGTTYTIIYGAPGFNPATPGAGTTVTAGTSPGLLTGLAASTSYDVYIRANCGATDQSSLVGPVRLTTPCTPPIITTFPYTENFDGVAAGSLPCGISVLNANNDVETWNNRNFTGFSASAPNAMVYQYDEVSVANDWFFTPALFMQAGRRYQLQFKYRSNPAFPERLEVKYGTAATVAAMTTTIWQNANITNGTFATTGVGAAPAVTPIQPTTSGNYYIGFHVYSLPDQDILAVDDLSVSIITGTSDALGQAISVYPNPSNGQVWLDIKGAGAKGDMQVEITNALGQVVFTGSARDNFNNKLDLSKVAAGLYTLKVKSGNDYTIRNLMIQK